jgi:outer membrane lipopolysaccharide assembly protein LptE/RlpB
MLLCATLLALLVSSGCGYHAVANRSPLGDANGVNVVLFANKSYRPGLEGILGRELVDELALRTGGRVLSGDEAQLELTGSVTSYTTLPVSYTSQDTIKEYRTAIKVEATLREKQTQKVVWKGELTEDQTFPVDPNIALQQNAETAASQRVCRKLSEDIWRKISERF